MTDNKHLAKRANDAYAKHVQLNREGAQPNTGDKYLEKVRDASAECDQLKREVEQTIRSGQVKTEQDLRYVGNSIVMWFLSERKLLDIREQNYQRALGEMRDIETSAKQDMNRLGQ